MHGTGKTKGVLQANKSRISGPEFHVPANREVIEPTSYCQSCGKLVPRVDGTTPLVFFPTSVFWNNQIRSVDEVERGVTEVWLVPFRLVHSGSVVSPLITFHSSILRMIRIPPVKHDGLSKVYLQHVCLQKKDVILRLSEANAE